MYICALIAASSTLKGPLSYSLMRSGRRIGVEGAKDPVEMTAGVYPVMYPSLISALIESCAQTSLSS
jgi:hypothetical protein